MVVEEVVPRFLAGVPVEDRLAAGEDLVVGDGPGAALAGDQVTLGGGFGVAFDPLVFGFPFGLAAGAGEQDRFVVAAGYLQLRGQSIRCAVSWGSSPDRRLPEYRHS